MKAIVYTRPNHLELKEIPIPSLNQALIKVSVCGICGTDISILQGKHPRAKPPLVLGHEFSGEVVEIKDSQKGSTFKRGDKVIAFPLIYCGQCLSCRTGNEHVCRNLKMIGIDRAGGMAEYVSIPFNMLVKIEDAIFPQVAALIEPLAVAVHSIRESGSREGTEERENYPGVAWREETP